MNVATAPIPIRPSARLSSGLFDEMVVDNFAGGGGASRGIEAAIGRAVDVAVNHDEDAVRTHALNHPHTRHLCESVWDVVPEEVTRGRKVGLAWFSPDCTHFSRAKGGKPVKKRIRGLAWVVIRWAKRVRPRVIILENVREFQTWGPLTAGNLPCPQRKGQTFRRWVSQLRNLGYAVEWRELNAADYGAPTHRRRFFLIARSDGQPIVWPAPTHGPGRRPYHTAAECIDWTIPCPSIFLTKAEAKPLGIIRPLAEKTMRRIAMGLKRYVLDNPKPFIVRCAHGDNCANGRQRWGRADHSLGEPIPTLTGSKDFALVTPYVAGVGGRTGQGNVPHSPGDAPLGTITAKNDRAVVLPFLAQRYGEAPHQDTRGQVADAPLHTVTPTNNSGVLIAPTLVGAGGADYAAKPRAADRPFGAVMPENRGAVAAAFLAKHYGGVVGHGPDRPLGTVTAIDHHSAVTANLLKFRGDSAGAAVDEPLPTVTSGAGAARPAGAAHALGLSAANLIKMNHGDKQWSGADEPVPTILAGANHHAAVRAFLMKYYGQGLGQECSEPLHTVTGNDRFGIVTVAGEPYQIVDIGMRMLSPRELLRAQFGKYAKDYVLTGPKWLQVKLIGNSVAPQMAEALVRANYLDVDSQRESA